MNAAKKAARKQIKGLVSKWHELLGFDALGITIEHRYIDGLRNEDEATVIADTEAQWEYRQATIRWFLPAVCRLDKDEIESTVLHEFIHVLNNPAEKNPDEDEKLVEFSAETLTLAVLNVARLSGSRTPTEAP